MLLYSIKYGAPTPCSLVNSLQGSLLKASVRGFCCVYAGGPCSVFVLLLLLLLLMDKNCLAVQDCQARPQAFESAHILLFSINHQDSS